MNGLRSHFKKAMAAWICLQLIVVFFSQRSINQSREQLGLTRLAPLENAPPLLAFTTVALGGFRGMIANSLWIRSMDLQDQGKYFELAQLADWITKLQPHFSAVWINQAWNLSYNISIKFQNPRDRWQWVQRGIELLRDEALRYNPNDAMIYRELAWQYQHKIGAYLDDAHLYYKQALAKDMMRFFPDGRPNYDSLLNPATAKTNALLTELVQKYKLDPAQMRKTDETYGPFDWRLPEAHAVYWGYLGLAKAKDADLMPLRRVIYQSMQTSFYRGRLLESKFNIAYAYGPNLDIVTNAAKAYAEMKKLEPKMSESIGSAERNFLRDAIYFLYTHNRMARSSLLV